ncbi:MAG: ORF6N domain-containing protein [Bacteroidales bacterium]|nr:ORF6N domain-containing protein [Bacteroidales bacterium]
MIDSDLAILYQVETKVLNQAVKRNIDRFPSNFSFYLTPKEFENWKSQIVTSNREKYGLRKLPRAFTEQGIAMLSAVLKSDTAVKISIEIMQSFVNFRHLLVKNKNLLKKIILIEKQQMEHAIRQNTFEQEQNKLQDQQNQLEINTKSQFSKVFNAIDKYHIMPNQGIFFDGQIFDAHHFVSDLIRSAEKSIILIDNYVDDSVLHLLTKRNNGVSVLIYSQKISKSLQLDLKKYNAQYSPVKMIEYAGFHDRFLILDHMRLYHIGASLKDLGKKVFAFSLLEVGLNEILRKIMHAN